MTQYNYEKDVVCKRGLWYTISNSDISSAILQNITWEAPNSLSIIYSEELSGEDQTTLADIVTAHDGCMGDAPKTTSKNLISSSGIDYKLQVDDDGVLYTEEDQ